MGRATGPCGPGAYRPGPSVKAKSKTNKEIKKQKKQKPAFLRVEIKLGLYQTVK